MKYTTIVLIILCCLSCCTMAESLPNGADLFIEALRCRMDNHTLVHSLSYVTEQTYQMPTLSEEEIEKEIAEDEAAVRKAFGKERAEQLPWFKDIRPHVRDQSLKASVVSLFTVKYKAPSFSRKLLSLQIEREGQSEKKWDIETNVIEANVVSDKSESEGVVWLPNGRSARVNDNQSYTETLLNFGRLKGPPVLLANLFFLQDADAEKYEFSQEKIDKFKGQIKERLQNGEAKTLQTVSTATYDDNAKAFVVESSNNGKVIERYWIDANRGFVCPLLQYYDDKGKLLSEYRSENYFKHEKSGLWFPQLYKEMTTGKNGKQEFKEYRVDPSSLNVNFPIADEEFAIEIPEGAEVIDERRNKKSVRYIALNNGILSLGKEGLDLENKDWLELTDISILPISSFSILRLTLISIGVLVILYALFGRLQRKEK